MNKDIVLTTECGVMVDNIAYFAANELNLIFSLNLNTRKIQIEGFLPEEPMNEKRLVGAILCWDRKIVFVPSNARNIWISSLSFREWEKIDIPNSELKLKFMSAFIKNDKLFLLRHLYNESLVVDLKSKKIEIFHIDNQDFFFNVYTDSYAAHFASCSSNKVYTYHFGDDELTYLNVKQEKNSAVCIDNGTVFVSPRLGNKLVMLRESGENALEIANNSISTVGLSIIGTDVYVACLMDDESIVIHRERGIEKWDPKGMLKLWQLTDVVKCAVDRCGKCYLMDEESGEIMTVELRIERNVIEDYLDRNKYFDDCEIIIEGNLVPLKHYLEHLISC